MSHGRALRSMAGAALTLAGLLAVLPCAAHAQGTAVTRELARQKAQMLEGFFASPRLAAARAANPDATAPIETEARARLDAGRTALDGGNLPEAVEQFDAGIRAIARAVALAAVPARRDSQDAAASYLRLMAQSRGYLDAIDRVDGSDPGHRDRVSALRGRLGEAEQRFAAGDVFEAETAARAAYTDVVAMVGEVRRGHSVFVARTFASPEDEFDYERERHQSYRLLVEIALAEDAENTPSLAALAARVGTDSTRLAETAERQAAGGDAAGAIVTMEHATERLLMILRAAGLAVTE